jgi:hypothetical protein
MKKLLNKVSRFPADLHNIMLPKAKWSSRVENSSFYRIPSIDSFEVIPGENNKILKGTGLDRKEGRTFERTVHERNNKMNHYMRYKIRSMKLALSSGNPEEFWRIAMRQMKHSTAFRVSCTNTVLRGWYKDTPVHRVFQIINGVNLILKYESTHLKYFRVNIPKCSPQELLRYYEEHPDKAWPGKLRPLGVPTAPWRIVLNMWNGFLTLFLENELKKYNHAFMPKVGTNTALKDFATNIPKARYVYEFDFEGYFPSVSIIDVIFKLAKRGTPLKVLKKLLWLLINWPKNMSYFDDHDNERDLRTTEREWLTTGINRIETIFESSFSEFLQKFNQSMCEELLEEYLGFSISGGKVDQALKGLPQGAAPSTILSLLILDDWILSLKSKNIKWVMYADDGLLYSNEKFDPYPPDGLSFATHKSNWIVKNWIWQVDKVKFLGVKYDWRSELFEGSTKNGSTLKFGKDQLDLIKLIKYEGDYVSLMEALVHSGIWGLVLSKLYGGKFGQLDETPKAIYSEESYWGKFHNIVGLSRDKALQRTASTIACEWLTIQIEKSKGKRGKRWIKEEIRKWNSSERLRIQLQSLRNAVIWDDIWNQKDYKIDTSP